MHIGIAKLILYSSRADSQYGVSDMLNKQSTEDKLDFEKIRILNLLCQSLQDSFR